MVELLSARLQPRCLSADQQLRPAAAGAALAAAQSASVAPCPKALRSVCTLINSDSSICESFVQERPAKAGCGKSARPVCGGGGNAAVIGFASSRASLSTLLQNLFRAAHEVPVRLGPRALAKPSRVRG